MYVENPVAWGAKRICQDCKAKYYDLGRTPVVCPKCRAEFVEPPKAKSSTRAASAASRAQARATPFGHGSSPWARRSGAHSPFADARPQEDEEGKVPDDGDAETDRNTGGARDAETTEDKTDAQ